MEGIIPFDDLFATLVLGAVGLSFIAFGWPLAQGRVKPNRWYGYRTRRSLSNRAEWYARNRIAGRDMTLIGAAMAAFVGVTVGLRLLVYPSLDMRMCNVALAIFVACASLISTLSIPRRRL